jgi:zinc protease
MPENTAPGPLNIGTDVRADVTGPAIREILKEVEGMRAKPVTDDELALAKQSIARSLPAYFQNTSSTAGTVGNLFLQGLPPDYYQGLPQRIEAMTAADVFAATEAHLSPERMKVIAIGDRKTIDLQVAALKLAPIGYRRPDGRPVESTTASRLPLP